MQQFLYALSIRGMYLGLLVASLFNRKARLWIRGQRNLQDIPIPSDKDVAWFHCASLGEFDQGLPVMKAYKERFPDRFLVVTFFSPSGMLHYHKRDHSADAVMYLPLDTQSKARAFVNYLHPKDVFFVKYEYWHNHLNAAKVFGAKCYGVSSIFRPTHRFFKKNGAFFRSTLKQFEHFFVQNQLSLDLLKSIEITNATITGDTRYDRMSAVVKTATKDEKIADFVGNKPVIICGSTWPIDEEVIFPALLNLLETYQVIIAPHNISEDAIKRMEAFFEDVTQRYTSVQNLTASVLILDTIGQLTAAYSFADIAYVGGGFTGKLHNILEPGAFGVPVIIGPKHERFPEAQLFKDRGVLNTIQTTDEFLQTCKKMHEDRIQIKAELAQIFSENEGAAKKIVAALT